MSSLQDAQQALANGDLDEVQAIAAGLLKTDPNSAEAWYILSQAVSGDRQEIFKNKALLLDPDIESKMGTSEPDLVDELFDSNLPDFPDLDGTEDDTPPFEIDDDSTDEVVPDSMTTADLSGDFVDEPYPIEMATGESEPTVDSETDIQDMAGNTSSIDFNLISLVVIGIAMLVVLVLLIQSVFF